MADPAHSGAAGQRATSNLGRDYERRDWRFSTLLSTAIAIAIFLGVAPVIVLYGFQNIGRDVDRKLTALPPEPRLQTYPADDLKSYLAKQRELLQSYGWVDRSHGIAHVPVAVALKRAAERGLEGFPQKAATGQDSQPTDPDTPKETP